MKLYIAAAATTSGIIYSADLAALTALKGQLKTMVVVLAVKATI